VRREVWSAFIVSPHEGWIMMQPLATRPPGNIPADAVIERGAWLATGLQRGGSGDHELRLLVPYSGSVTADAGLEMAADWTRALGAEVWVLYVRVWDPMPGGGRIYIELPLEARCVAQKAVTYLRRGGVAASGIVRDAYRPHVADAIVAQAETLDVAYIVVGTRARRALTATLMGSTSLEVARRATRPVLMVNLPRRRRFR